MRSYSAHIHIELGQSGSYHQDMQGFKTMALFSWVQAWDKYFVNDNWQ